MQYSRLTGFVAIAALVIPGLVTTACSDAGTGPAPITVADLQGSWRAQSYKITDAAVSVVAAEIISMGATFTWNVDAAGRFTGSMFIPASLAGQDLSLNFQGSIALAGQDSIVVSFTPEIPPFLTIYRAGLKYYGTTMILTNRNTTFDFGNGQRPAIFEGTMVRR
jgi:hypothetical protein